MAAVTNDAALAVEMIKFIDEKLNPLLAENEPSQKGMDAFLRKEYRKPRGEDGMIV